MGSNTNERRKIEMAIMMLILVGLAFMMTPVSTRAYRHRYDHHHTLIPSARSFIETKEKYEDFTMEDAPRTPDDPGGDDNAGKVGGKGPPVPLPHNAHSKARADADKQAQEWNMKRTKVGNLTVATFNKPIDLNPKVDPNAACKNVPVPTALGGNWNTELPDCITRSPLDGTTCVQWSHKCLQHGAPGECLVFGDHLECWKYQGCGKGKRCVEFANNCANFNDEEGYCLEFAGLKKVTGEMRLSIQQNYDSYMMTCCSSEDMEARREKARQKEAAIQQANTGSCTQSPNMLKLILGELEGVSREMFRIIPMDVWMETKQYIIHNEMELRQAVAADGGAWITFAGDTTITLTADLDITKERIIIDGRSKRVLFRGNREQQARINIKSPMVILIGLTFSHFTGALPGATWQNRCQGASDDECKRMSSRDIIYIPDDIGLVWIHRCRFRGLSRAINIGGRAHYELPPMLLERDASQRLGTTMKPSTTINTLGDVVPTPSHSASPSKGDTHLSGMATGYAPTLTKLSRRKEKQRDRASRVHTIANEVSQQITVSWCRFDNHWDAVKFSSRGRLTLHHCYFRNTRGSLPKCMMRDTGVHVYNVIVDGFGATGALSSGGCSSIIESSSYLRAKWTDRKASAIMCDRGLATIREVFAPDDPQRMMCMDPSSWEPCHDYPYHLQWDGNDQPTCRGVRSCDGRKNRICIQDPQWAVQMIKSVSNELQKCFLVDYGIHLY